MPLNPIDPRLAPPLRRFVNKSNDVAKVSLVVPPGEEVHASDYVGNQLGASFADLDAAPAVEPVASDDVPEAADEEKPKAKTSKKG